MRAEVEVKANGHLEITVNQEIWDSLTLDFLEDITGHRPRKLTESDNRILGLIDLILSQYFTNTTESAIEDLRAVIEDGPDARWQDATDTRELIHALVSGEAVEMEMLRGVGV